MPNWPGKLYPDLFGIPVALQAPQLECQTGPEIAIINLIRNDDAAVIFPSLKEVTKKVELSE